MKGIPVAAGISPAELRTATISVLDRITIDVLDRITRLLAAEQPLFVLCEDLHFSGSPAPAATANSAAAVEDA